MKPVFPNETRLQRALFAARLRQLPGKDRTLLSAEAQDDITAEFLEARKEADALAIDNEQLRQRLDVKTRPVHIEAGKQCEHGRPIGSGYTCVQCVGLKAGGE
ncbi:MAG: hypothetical protein Q8K32_09390 [Archangium sp.]|nr:hypothetical protein [Archangium sp.]